MAISAIQKPETRTGLKESWDSLVKVMFAPCAGGDIGGVPRDEMMGTPPISPAISPSSRVGGTDEAEPAWGASVPFEVSASSLLEGQSFHGPGSHQHPQHYPIQQAQTPREQRSARSRAKLRQLGARHQLAGGFPGESLADTARPISFREEVVQEEVVVDFDDGISAISSHTLEDMERRRQIQDKRNMLRLHPMDFSQIVEEEDLDRNTSVDPLAVLEGEDEKNTEVLFGEPFYEEGAKKQISQDYPTQELAGATDFDRVQSTRTNQTLNTTITDDSKEFEDFKRHEAVYWTNQDQVGNGEGSVGFGRQTRTSQHMGIEERARRLRDLSRSRSRSDGTGSSNKSGASSLSSGQHPHDTMPVYSSDLYTRRKKASISASGTSWRKSLPSTQQQDRFVRGSRAPASVMEESDPFASLGYGEI